MMRHMPELIVRQRSVGPEMRHVTLNNANNGYAQGRMVRSLTHFCKRFFLRLRSKKSAHSREDC